MNATSLQKSANHAFNALLEFCQTTGRACYSAYSPEVLRDYLAFHIAHGSLRFVRAPGTLAVTGCAVAWRLNECTILTQHTFDLPVFDWQPDEPQGDALFIADVVCADAATLRSLIASLAHRYPGCARLKWYTYRRGELVAVRPLVALRFLRRGKENNL